jgi:hypothetical protein
MLKLDCDNEPKLPPLDAVGTGQVNEKQQAYLDEIIEKVPSRLQADEVALELPHILSVKVLLLINLMLEWHCSPVDLDKAMGVIAQEVTRLLNIKHATKIDTMAAAFKALGNTG